ncbi:MAG: HIT family protein, partial [Gammaproteobacteria bacterium]
MAGACELCHLAVPPVYQDDKLSVILVDDAAYPGFARVIWKQHVREMSDLSAADRAHIHEAVHRVELAVRATLTPLKVNVASLGNVVPHLHWHVVARFAWDSHFPQPIWGP